MFCPGCGLKDTAANQFCRACGANLGAVRQLLEQPDSITASAVSARDEIGRAFADKIREARSSEELAEIADDVLPEIEKFLESPAEKRLRRMRTGTIISSVGLGATLMFLLLVSNGADSVFMIGLSIVTFFIGLGFILNALLFSEIKKSFPERAAAGESQRRLDGARQSVDVPLPSGGPREISSVTEFTTKNLRDKKRIQNS